MWNMPIFRHNVVRSVPRHSGPRTEVSQDTLAPAPKCPDSSDPHFRSKVSWIRSVLGPWCRRLPHRGTPSLIAFIGTTGVSWALLVYMQNCQPTLLVLSKQLSYVNVLFKTMELLNNSYAFYNMRSVYTQGRPCVKVRKNDYTQGQPCVKQKRLYTGLALCQG